MTQESDIIILLYNGYSNKMKVYFDVFSNDEMISDSYPFTLEYNDAIMIVPSRMIVKGGENVDIGRGNEFGGGDEDEALDPNVERVNEIVNGFSLQETSFTKKEFVQLIKAYLQKLRKHITENNPERVQGFMEGASAFVKWAVSTFDEFKFYTGSNYDITAMIVLSYYKIPEDEAPHFLFMKDGLREEKY